MFTISDILQDINRGCAANNMIEDCFTYRIIFFVKEGGKDTKHYMDTVYGDIRKSLEDIIRNHLSLTNHVIIANTTVLKNGKCVCLQNRSYAFSLDEYFKRIGGERNDWKRNRMIHYEKCALR